MQPQTIACVVTAGNTPIRFFSKEKSTIGDGEWGIKYDDECLKFEKEWKTIAEKVEHEQMVYLEKELSEL